MAKACLHGDENDEAQVGGAKFKIAHPIEPSRAAAENCKLAKNHKRDDGNVETEHRVGEMANLCGRQNIKQTAPLPLALCTSNCLESYGPWQRMFQAARIICRCQTERRAA